ncbi:TetR/AcrR family transcriptional regulator [Termitidicoccus mucosus]
MLEQLCDKRFAWIMPAKTKGAAIPAVPVIGHRRDPERTRARLLKTAIQMFSAKGYHGVSVDEVVEAAKVNKRMVYHYFGSKEDLYLAALEEVFGRFVRLEIAPLASDASPMDKLSQLLAANFEFLEKNPEFVRLLLWENLDNGQRLAAHPQYLTKNPFMDRFRMVVEEGVKAGVFRQPRDMRHLLVNFIGLSFVYYSNRYSLAATIGLKNTGKETHGMRLAQVIDLVLNGLLAR